MRKFVNGCKNGSVKKKMGRSIYCGGGCVIVYDIDFNVYFNALDT